MKEQDETPSVHDGMDALSKCLIFPFVLYSECLSSGPGWENVTGVRFLVPTPPPNQLGRQLDLLVFEPSPWTFLYVD